MDEDSVTSRASYACFQITVDISTIIATVSGQSAEDIQNSYRVMPSVNFAWLLQLCILGLGSDENGNVRVGVFPKREEIIVSGAGFGGVALQGVGASESEACQRTGD